MSEETSGRHDHAARYKELAGLATSAVDRVREHERELAARLEDDLAASAERVAEAERERERVADGVRIRWKAAMEALWDERWMRVTSRPAPDPSAPAAPAEECIRRVQSAYLELHNALGRKGRSTPSWLPRPGRRPGTPDG